MIKVLCDNEGCVFNNKSSECHRSKIQKRSPILCDPVDGVIKCTMENVYPIKSNENDSNRYKGN